MRKFSHNSSLPFDKDGAAHCAVPGGGGSNWSCPRCFFPSHRPKEYNTRQLASSIAGTLHSGDFFLKLSNSQVFFDLWFSQFGFLVYFFSIIGLFIDFFIFTKHFSIWLLYEKVAIVWLVPQFCSWCTYFFSPQFACSSVGSLLFLYFIFSWK